jgi:hypothetical protein
MLANSRRHLRGAFALLGLASHLPDRRTEEREAR